MTEHSERSLRAVADALHIPLTHLSRALEVFKHDSQADTQLSGRTLRKQKLYELGDDDIRRAEAVARRYGLDPDVAAHLPGHLLNS